MEDSAKYTWKESAIYVLKTLEILDDKLERLSEHIDKKLDTISNKMDENDQKLSAKIDSNDKALRDDIADLRKKTAVLDERIKIRSAGWGAIGSAVIIVAYAIIQIFFLKK